MRTIDAEELKKVIKLLCEDEKNPLNITAIAYFALLELIDTMPTIIDTQIAKKADWQIGDEIRDEELNSNAIIVGVYEHQYECIAFNGSDFDAFNIPCDGTIVGYKRTGKHFEQINEMIKIMGGNVE